MLPRTAFGIQSTLQRVCHHLVRHKTTTPQLGDASRSSLSSRRAELSSHSRFAKSDTKMPVTFANGASVTGTAAAGTSSTATDGQAATTRRASVGDDDSADALAASRQASKKKFAAVLPASPTTTPAKKSPSAKKMGTAEDYHNVLLNNRSVVVPVITERLYLARLHDVPVPRVSDAAVFFSTDEEFMYENFFDDFGPLNIGNVYRYCKKIEKKMRLSGSRGRKLVHVGWSADNRLFTNTAWLTGAYCIVVEKMSPEIVFERVCSLLNQTDLNAFPAFRDAATGPSTYDLSLLDCYRALAKAIQYGFFDYNTFNIVDYEHYEKVENGDFNWISSKFLAFCGPSATSRLDNGYPLHAPDVYFSYFRKQNVTTVVRLNAPQYPAKRFTDAGFEHHDLIYPDGTSPPMAILNRFLRICESAPGAVAVHCKAGLGRTGTLIGAYLMKHYRLTTAETIAWLRISRPGSVIGQQQHFLEGVKETLWKQGEACRLQAASAPTAAATMSTTADAGASGDAGLAKGMETSSSTEQLLKNDETGMHTPPTNSGKVTNEIGNGKMSSSTGKAITLSSSQVIIDSNIGTPGKEARVRRQNAAEIDEDGITAKVGLQLKGRQAIRRPLLDGGAARGTPSTLYDDVEDDDAFAGSGVAGRRSPGASGGPEVPQRRTSLNDSANKITKKSNDATAAVKSTPQPMTTRRASKSSPALESTASLTTTTTSNKRKRLFATTGPSEKAAAAITPRAEGGAGKKVVTPEQRVTEEDVEGMISHAETVDEMAALKRQAVTAARNKKATPTAKAGMSSEEDEAVQPTKSNIADRDAADENPLKEEVRNERLMELFRANKLDKVATMAETSSADDDSSTGGDKALLGAGDEVAVSAPHCHLVSDTEHLTQGDMLNRAKAKRSVYPFGFGRGFGHGSPAAASQKAVTGLNAAADDTSKPVGRQQPPRATARFPPTPSGGKRDELNDSSINGEEADVAVSDGLAKCATRSAAKQTPNSARRSTVPATISPQTTPASNTTGNSNTAGQLGRTRRQSRALTSDAGSSTGVAVTPQRNLRGPTPPLPSDASDAAHSNAGSFASARQARRLSSRTGAATQSVSLSAKKSGTPSPVDGVAANAKAAKPLRSESAELVQQGQKKSSPSYSLRSKKPEAAAVAIPKK